MDSTKITTNIQVLYGGLGTLSELRKADIAKIVAHKVMRTVKNLRSEVETADEIRQELVKKYARRDENDEIVTEKLENGETGIVLENVEGFKAEWLAYLQSEITCEVYQLTFEELPDVCSAEMIENLENLGVLILPD